MKDIVSKAWRHYEQRNALIWVVKQLSFAPRIEPSDILVPSRNGLVTFEQIPTEKPKIRFLPVRAKYEIEDNKTSWILVSNFSKEAINTLWALANSSQHEAIWKDNCIGWAGYLIQTNSGQGALQKSEDRWTQTEQH